MDYNFCCSRPNRDASFVRYDTIPECDRQTERRTVRQVDSDHNSNTLCLFAVLCKFILELNWNQETKKICVCVGLKIKVHDGTDQVQCDLSIPAVVWEIWE